MHINVRKGLTIPLAGEPRQVIDDSCQVRSVALLGRDYTGLRPRMAVAQGDRVELGQLLFEDKQTPGVRYTSPGTGIVTAIHRGARRALQSVVIELDGDAAPKFTAHAATALSTLSRTAVRDTLIESGLWTALRTRPYSKVPAPDTEPAAIFVTAIDTNPLAADPALVIEEFFDDFMHGLDVIARLTDGTVYVCTGQREPFEFSTREQLAHVQINGPHPAGLVGTHIHFLDPVNKDKTVWHLNYQDVIAAGRLFTTGQLWSERVISLAGSMVETPRLVRARLGANTEELVAGQLRQGQARVISGPVLAGDRAIDAFTFLGRYHLQVCVLPEGQPRELFNWMMPGAKKFSGIRAFAGHLMHRKPFALSTSQNGSPRAMVPIGNFEPVMPLDILPAPLLKALLVRDTDTAQALGCLELDEEDLALCSFVCSGKREYGPELRECLAQIEKFG